MRVGTAAGLCSRARRMRAEDKSNSGLSPAGILPSREIFPCVATATHAALSATRVKVGKDPVVKRKGRRGRVYSLPHPLLRNTLFHAPLSLEASRARASPPAGGARQSLTRLRAAFSRAPRRAIDREHVLVSRRADWKRARNPCLMKGRVKGRATRWKGPITAHEHAHEPIQGRLRARGAQPSCPLPTWRRCVSGLWISP